MFFFTLVAQEGRLPLHYNLSRLNDDVVVSADNTGRITVNGCNLAVQFEGAPGQWKVWPGFARHPKGEPGRDLIIYFVSLLRPAGWIRITDGVDEKYNTLVDLSDAYDDLLGISEKCLLLRHEQTYSGSEQIVKK